MRQRGGRPRCQPAPAGPPRALGLPLEGRRDPTVAVDRPAEAGRGPDPLIAALARYVEALHRRYPDGPDELRHAGLDGRAKVSRMARRTEDPAA